MNCVFCKIIAGETDTKILYQDDRVTSFRDAHPKAPVHILIVPNRHIQSVNELRPEDETLVGHLFTTAAQLAEREGIHRSGYRLIINTGPDAGQSVFHLHLHLVGGKHMLFQF